MLRFLNASSFLLPAKTKKTLEVFATLRNLFRLRRKGLEPTVSLRETQVASRIAKVISYMATWKLLHSFYPKKTKKTLVVFATLRNLFRLRRKGLEPTVSLRETQVASRIAKAVSYVATWKLLHSFYPQKQKRPLRSFLFLRVKGLEPSPSCPD